MSCGLMHISLLNRVLTGVSLVMTCLSLVLEELLRIRSWKLSIPNM